jgi:putative DNA primase/helicase
MPKRIDRKEVQAGVPIDTVIGRYVQLRKDGKHLTGTCPFHNDHKASLCVTPSKQMYKCFACGAGGDSIDFLTRMGATYLEAVKSIREEYKGEFSGTREYVHVEKPEEIRWEQIAPTKPMPVPRHYKYGAASNYWHYHNAAGNVLGCVARFDNTPDGKQVLPFVFATDGTRREWRWMGFDFPRPLYNLHLLTANPNAGVVLVEGEKTADAVQAHFDPSQVVVTTWIGGANGTHRADFTPLHGRRVTLWPDADTTHEYGPKHAKAGQLKPFHEQPGNKAMLDIAEQLTGHAQSLQWIRNPEDVPCGWDAADKEWQQGELRDFIISNRGEVPVFEREAVPVPPPAPMPPPAPPRAPAPPKNEAPKNFMENEFFRLLGYDKTDDGGMYYYFYSIEARTVVRLKPAQMSKSNLIMLAPLNYWEDAFPGTAKSKIDVDAAQQFLIGLSHRVGIFTEKLIRGRGAWEDNGKFVIHTGDKLIVDREPKALNGLKSRYVYEIGESLMFGTAQPLSTGESRQVIDQLKWLLWERDVNAYLLAGWCVIAPFCGVLNWRPHIWVTGPAGSGKSWVLDNVVKRLLGETAVVVQGKTTEPGIRGTLQNDARPVVFDETDVDNKNDQERVQNILSLARSSSYRDGGAVSKGTQGGGSRSYIIRSCFAFSSIGVQVRQQSDRSRFTMIGVRRFEGLRTADEFQDFSTKWMATVSDEYVARLQSRTIGLLPVILRNAKTFSEAVASVIGNRRIGDQVGGMLAGAFSLSSTKEITLDEAVKWVEKRDWSEERGLEATKDEFQLLSKLMNHMVRVESERGTVERTVGELVAIASGRTEPGISPEVAHMRLRRMGFMLNAGRLMVANNSDGVMAIVRETSWSANYNRILERLTGAERVEPRMFSSGIKSRSVGIPLSLIMEDEPGPKRVEMPAQKDIAPTDEEGLWDAPF